MASISHTLTLPLNPGAWPGLSLPAQDASTIRTSTLDCARYLADAGTTIERAVVTRDASLAAGLDSSGATTVTMTVSGGTPGTVAAIGISLFLANGDRENVTLSIPILHPAPMQASVASEPAATPDAPVPDAERPSVPGAWPPAGGSGLLDALGATVAAAYGLRALRSAYAGPAIRVRRGSDNAERDIGFTAGGLDEASVLAFCGPGDGFVSRWHDQGPAGFDLANPTPSNQPQIVAAGVLVAFATASLRAVANASSRPALRFAAASGTVLWAAAVPIGGAAFAWAGVASATAHADQYARLAAFGPAHGNDYTPPGAIFAYLADPATLKGFSGGELSGGAVGAAPFQAASVFDGASHVMTVDGMAAAPAAALTAAAPPFATLSIGAGFSDTAGGNCWDGASAEHIVISGALGAADQAAIRASQQAYYGTP